jgi:hypothetical protein
MISEHNHELFSNMSLYSQFKPATQGVLLFLHHTGKSHWVTSLQDKKDGTVYVLDSYSKTFTLTPSLEIQLSAIYGQGK